MNCIITYKGKKYSEKQFKEYFINNKQEFATSIAKNKDVIASFKRKKDFSSTEEGGSELIALLGKIVNRLDIQLEKQQAALNLELEKEQNRSVLKGRTKKALKEAEQKEAIITTPETSHRGASRTTHVKTTSYSIDGLDMVKLKKELPDSQESLYIKQHNITLFLSDPDNLDKNTPIMFISDPTLLMEGDDFEDSAPLVAVVEVPSGGISVIVDNVEKHYQPIAIMPRSSENSPGAANLRLLRSQINKDAIGDLLRDENGNIIQTKLFPRIYAEAPERVQEHEDNVSLLTAGMESLTDTLAEQAKDLSKAERRSTTWYKKLRKKITDALEIINFDGLPVLSLNINNLKGKNKDKSKETYPYVVLTTPVFKSVDKNSDTLIIDLFKNNQIEEALESNSRIIKFTKGLHNIFNSVGFDPSKMSLDEVKPGEFVLSETTQKLLQATENELNKVLGNAFLLPSRREKFSYKLEPIIEGNEWKKDGLGRKLFQLNLVSNNEERPPIQLGNITQGALSKLTAFDIIKNLFLDEQGLPRMRSETEGLVKWQISYNDVRFKDTNPTAKAIIEEILDDDILTISEKSLDYLIHGIGIANPFNNKGELRIQGNDSNPVVVSNPDNANTSSESNEVIKTSLDIEVNTETGQPVEKIKTQPKRKNNTVSKVLQILDTIEESSEELELDEEGGFYISNKTGNRFIRVTSLKEGMSEDNPFALVSSSIGTSVDELIRDIFNDKIKNLIYPNMNQESLDAFIKSILQIKNKLESEGLTIISRDVTLAGNINITGADGKTTKTLPVAGTLDLLAYDAEGNFVIIDIKSHRGIYSEDKYQQLLSLYKELLLQQGAKVKKLLILSVGVNYADPIGWKNGRVKYTLTNPEATDPLEKLLINAGKKLFDRANPTFEGLMDLKEISLNFEESDLKEEHKALLKENQTKESPKLSSNVVEIAGLPIENFDLGFEDPLSNVLEETSLRFIPERLEWGTWKGFLKDGKPLNIEETKASLALKGITLENWNDRTEEEMEHELLCS